MKQVILLLLACTAKSILADLGDKMAWNAMEGVNSLRQEIQSLKEANARLESKIDSMRTILPAWDCIKKQDMTESNIVPFDFCGVDTTGGDPSTGLLSIEVSG